MYKQCPVYEASSVCPSDPSLALNELQETRIIYLQTNWANLRYLYTSKKIDKVTDEGEEIIRDDVSRPELLASPFQVQTGCQA